MASKKENDAITYLSREIMFENYYNGFIDKLVNNITIEGEDIGDDVPNDYIIKTLIKYGCIGVYNKVWLPITATDGVRDLYGRPNLYTLTGANGRIITASRDDAHLIRFTPTKRKINDWLSIEINKLIDIDLSVYANLINTRQTTILISSDGRATQDLKNAYKKQALGVPVIIDSNKVIMDGVKVQNTTTPLIINDLLKAHSTIVQNINITLGIVGGIDKRERVQSYDLPLNDAIDSIYTMIDTFNKDCKKYGVKASMRLNGAIEELYNSDNVETDSAQDERGNDNE